ncbi:hypothetical protein [Lolliginicoccus suaedae]|uniref:hypothetical protein n=1 Tax=Lolliginicoccus suaedae TaxID=2605429 RepID=UPI001F220595|nr:hypothetical protein [Lolliginicoccus suaedae]
MPLTSATTALLRAYLARHPRAHCATAPLFPASRLIPERPTGVRAARPAAQVLGDLSAEQTAARLDLDWDAPLRRQNFYKAVYRPAVLRANGLAGAGLPADL